MLENLKEYAGRKRTKDMIIGIIALIICDKLGVGIETTIGVGALVGVKLGGQSYSDGQEAASHKTALNVVEVPPSKPT